MSSENHSNEQSEVSKKLTDIIHTFIGDIPDTKEMTHHSPDDRAREIAHHAALKAAASAGALALPLGPLGILTIIPEIKIIWQIQRQMVVDIAGTYGKSATLSQSQMMFCLFKHGAAMAVRSLIVQKGEKFLVKKATSEMIQVIVKKVGVSIAQKGVSKGISRFIPIVGSLGVGAYAYYDTNRVAKTAIELFKSDLVMEK